MTRLPTPGADTGKWGDILNEFLSQAHTSDGKLKTDSVTAGQLAPGSVVTPAIADGAVTNSKLDIPTKASLAKADSALQPADLGAAAILDVGTTAGTVAAGNDSRITGAQAASSLDASVAVHLEDITSQTRTAVGNLLSAGRDALLYPDHLERWRRTLADARWGLKHVMAVGHSLVEGFCAHNASAASPDHSIFRTRGYVPHLRSIIADRYGNVGEGYLLCNDVRATNSGASTIQSTGPYKNGRRLDAPTDTVTWTGISGRYIRARLWMEDTTKTADGGFISVDGGAEVAIAGRPGSGTDTFYTSQVIDVGSAGTHTVVIRGPTGGNPSFYIDLCGVEIYDVDPTTAIGIAVHRWGQGGGYCNTAFYDSAGASQTRQLRASFTSPTCDLLILHFISNEASTTGQPLGHTPATLAAIYQTVVNYQTVTNGGSALIVAGPRRDSSSIGTNYSEQQYIDAVRAIADANPHCAMIDYSRVWGDYGNANADGLMYDTVHPTRLGHSDMARMIAEALDVF